MNTILKVAGGFVLGAAVGSLVTYFIVRDGFQASADEQIENMRQYYIKNPPKERKIKEPEKPEGSIYENLSPILNRKPDEAGREYEKQAQKYMSHYTNPDMEDLISRIGENDLDEDGNAVEIEFSEEDARKKPYLIPEESYMRTYPGLFDSEALEFWVSDNVLRIADSDEVVDIDSTIGYDAINALLDPERKSDVVYARNEKLKMEYEIERMDGDYFELFDGSDGKPIPIPKVEQRRQRNKYEDDDN